MENISFKKRIYVNFNFIFLFNIPDKTIFHWKLCSLVTKDCNGNKLFQTDKALEKLDRDLVFMKYSANVFERRKLDMFDYITFTFTINYILKCRFNFETYPI
jgi:hypothetical protein